jgi:hypothetical protein|tara:strand:- start:1799 stop:2017 length:219 start_codon:yes stop_codon:yes gene_type:complete
MEQKDIINLTAGFIVGVLLVYITLQATIQQMYIVTDKAYQMTVEMETKLEELRLFNNKNDIKSRKKIKGEFI